MMPIRVFFLTVLLTGCLLPQQRTCPSSLPSAGATLEQAALEYVQLTNDLRSAERDYQRYLERHPDLTSLDRKRERLGEAVVTASSRRDELVAIMDRWEATKSQPAEWKAANTAYREALEVALARAEATY